MTDVTRILNQIEGGNQASLAELFPAVYDELRRMAAGQMAGEAPGQTLDATGLVHEAWMRLGDNQKFESRRHFFGAAAQAMRRILIDRARARRARKRGGDAGRADLDLDQIQESATDDDRLEALDEALDRLEQQAPDKAELVKLRYFAGLKIHESAEILGISTATADRHWAYARAWLQTEISDSSASD